MAQFLKTDNVPGHNHLVYVNDATQVAACSVDDGHIHDVVFDPNMGQWVVGFGPDGHSHVLMDLNVKKYSVDEQSPEDVVEDVYSLFRTWVEADADNVKDAETAEKFYWGEQWDRDLKDNLEAQGRAALTINQIERMVDALCGEQRQERTDLRYYPLEGGDQRVADILNHVSKHLLENCFFPREESKVFEDVVVAGRGVFNVYVDFKKNIQGEIRVERFPWGDVVFGPHDKEDLSDCEGLIKHRMYSRARLKSMFPKHEDDINKVFVDAQLDPKAAGSVSVGYASGNYLHPDTPTPWIVGGQYPTIDIAKKELRLIECWRKVYEPLHVIVNLQDNFYYRAENWSTKLVNQARTLPGFSIVERETEKIRISKVVGNILLSDEYPAELPDDDFFMVPVYGKRRDGKWKGKVFSGIDSQREVNKRHSQAIDIGNTAAGYGWFYDDTTFPDDKAQRDFDKHSASPGFKLKITDLNRPPTKVEGGKFPAEIVQLMQMSDQALTNVMSIDVRPTGANQSAAHFLEVKKLRFAANEHLFDNLTFAKKKLGTLLVKLIQRYYTPERLLRLLQTSAAVPSTPSPEVGGQPLESYDPNEIISLLSNSDLVNYDVVVSESGYSPTARLGTFMLLTQMAQSGAPVPPELMVEFMDIPAELKQKIQNGLAAQAQAQQQTQSANAEMEINKTLIAKGIIPPEVQAKLGEQGQQPQLPAPEQPIPQGGELV